MIFEPIVNLGIVGATCILLLIYLLRFTLRYKHEYESNLLCTATVLFCLVIVLIATFILPVDIFMVSFVKESDGTFKSWATNETLQFIDNSIFAAYYTLYGLITFLIFVAIPFLHFFNEESESNSRDRLHNAIKYTFCIAIIMAILLTFGAVMQTGPDANMIISKIIHLSNNTKFQNALNMVLAIITTAGFLNVSFYTASGIFSWPIGLLLGTSSVANRFTAVSDREVVLRMRVSNLQDKARYGRLTAREQAELIDAERNLRDLERESAALSSYTGSLTYKMRSAIRPIQMIVGSFFGLLSIFLVVTLVMVNIDRLLHGAGPKQGYVLIKPQIFNPLEFIYTKSQDLLFIGPLPLLLVMSFLVVATISGIRNLGLWFMFARLHRIKIRRTQPQALLFFCITIMLAALSFNLIIYSMTTQYVTFGNQNQQITVNGTTSVKPCTLDDYKDNCILTRTSILLMRMMSQVWLFGAIFYWWTWAFVVVATLSLIAYMIRGKREASHGIISVEDEFED